MRAFSGFRSADMKLTLTSEGLMQQRFFQRFERGELLLVDGFEPLGFGSTVLTCHLICL